MNLVVNRLAAMHSSLGVRRYSNEVLRHLCWPGGNALSPPIWKAPALARMSELVYLGRKEEIFWSPAQRGPLWARNHVLTVHDCISIEYVYRQDWRLPAFRRLFQAILDNARAVVAISNSTLSVLSTLFELDQEKAIVIKSPMTVGLNLVSAAESASSASAQPFVLMVTNALPHKNTLRACQALTYLRHTCKDLTLRVVGSLSPQAIEVCTAAGLRLELRTGVSDRDLALWYRQALFLFSPSLQEGHNLPVAEALACNARVLCSNIPVHREFYEGMVLFCPPDDIEGMARMIDFALDDSAWSGLRLPGTQRSFVDVANEYRVLFERIATESGA
jgi:glycosyltransferase involved in cell wall biosynthesis